MNSCASLWVRPTGVAYLTPSPLIAKYLRSVRKLKGDQIPLTLSQDMEEIQHAFVLASIFSQMDLNALLHECFSSEVQRVLSDSTVVFEHVGTEVFSPVNELKKLIERYIVRDQLSVKIFKSVQVLEFVKEYDPEITQIDIMLAQTQAGHAVELFSCHQSYIYTMLRKSNRQVLFADATVTSLSHIALRVDNVEVLQKIQSISRVSSEFSILGKGVYFNPGDGSYNIKVILNKAPAILSGQALEFIYVDR